MKLLILFTILSMNVFSQTKGKPITAKVSYNVEMHLDKNHETYKFYEKNFPGLISRVELIDSEVDFSLIFNDSTSVFYLEKKLYSDNRATSVVIRNSKYYGRIKQQKEHYVTEELQESFGRFLVSRKYQDWVLFDESKMIDSFTCFKAKTFYSVTTPEGKIFKYEFIAWYTPQLPYKFGPAGFGNLPGLIIELQGENFTYGVKKIEFNNNLEHTIIEMPTLKKLKLITDEEFEKLAFIDEKNNVKKD